MRKMPRAVVLGLAGLALSAFAFAQTDSKPAFVSADVHPVPLLRLGDNMSGGVLRGGRYEVRSATMVDLVRLAYGVEVDRILGGPAWLETDRFDVLATAPAGATADSAKLMLQALLADRFGLVVHPDERPLPVYVLTMGKGNKMKASADSAGGCQGTQQPPAAGATPAAVISCKGMTMDAFAENIHQMANGYFDHPVVNQTKLAGEWDFDLSWTPRGALSTAGPDGVSVFDAIDRQLGLKVEPQKMAMPVLFVEKANEKPTPNAPGIAIEPEPPVEFEAADIKSSQPGAQGFRFLYQPGGRINGEGSLADFIGSAFGVPPNQRADLVVGLPPFAATARYEIIAKTPSSGAGAATHDGGRDTPPPLSVALEMLHNMLNQRFKLKTHAETQEVTVYALTVDRGGPRMTKSDGSSRAACKPDPNGAPASTNGTPSIAMRCTNTSMEEFVRQIANAAGGYIDHPSVDASGLSDRYDFVLYWTPKNALHPVQPNATDAGAAVDPGGLSVFEAIQKELGLKLDVAKRRIPVTVIDHLEEKPTDD